MLAAILLFSVNAEAISAQKAIVMDATTGHILYEKNSVNKALIASTTKIMTALIVCEQTNVLDRVRIPKEAVGIEGSSLYLQEGEVLTVQELLYGLMLHSGNDAAVALAIYCGGTIECFVQMMNDKARSVGMTNSNFENPHGLDSPHHYSTAKDMALLTAYAMKNPIFLKTVSTKTVNISRRSLRNHNKLLWRLDGAEGVKTGFTKAAGRILVSSTFRDGRRLVAVTMDAPGDWEDHTKLINDGFTHYKKRFVVEEGECVGYLDVSGGEFRNVPLLAKDSCICMVADWESVTVELQEYGVVYAPVVSGQEAGVAFIKADGEVIGRVSVEYGMTVERYQTEKVPFWKKLFWGVDS